MPTVFITGANRGLGLEFARQYANAGWRVIAASRAPDRAGALRALGSGVTIERLDVADVAAIAALARQLAAEAIDVLIANAGISAARNMTAATVIDGVTAWEHMFRVNAVAPLALAGAFHAQVARSGERKMIAITSRLGSMGANSDGGFYAYRSSKAALNAAWRSLALDHPEVIAVLLHPGWVRTDLGGPGGLLDPEQSVAAMRRVIANLGKADSGRFYNYDGSPIPW
jgi:NAD(P)-dependent dehydrogenase (short-subunit alcohol dehydrogenase family)